MRYALIPLILFALPAAAQEPTDAPPAERVQFIDLEEAWIHGTTTRPQGALIHAERRAKFERLRRLERSFLPKLAATARDVELR